MCSTSTSPDAPAASRAPRRSGSRTGSCEPRLEAGKHVGARAGDDPDLHARRQHRRRAGVGVRAGEPDRRAHRLQRRLRAAGRDPAAHPRGADARPPATRSAHGASRRATRRPSPSGEERPTGDLGRLRRGNDPQRWPRRATASAGSSCASTATSRRGGLSSSAALEVAVGRALREAFDLDLGDVEIAAAGRRAENDFVGVRTRPDGPARGGARRHRPGAADRLPVARAHAGADARAGASSW